MGGTGARNRRRFQRKQPQDGTKELFLPKREEKVQHNPSKKKIKKPKHLKRKLERAIQENSQDKEQILQEMQAWEQQKADYRRKGQKKTLHRNNKQADNSKQQFKEPTKESEPPRGDIQDETVDEKPTTMKESSPALETVEEEYAQVEPAVKGDSDSDGDSETPEAPKRQRGKRRRGRKDTSLQIKENAVELKPSTVMEDSKEAEDDAKTDGPTKKRKKDTARYCVGRKPVTDFVVGQRYPGKVVYIKPFGVFLDIGCHSDAFCHVSRLQDDYVETPEAIFKPGDSVDARVVEIDRRKKRITVSLQSDAKIEDERASIEARQQRLEKRKKLPKEERTPIESSRKQTDNDIQESQQDDVRGGTEADSGVDKPELEMTPAELKRKRKLERRAARRATKEQAAE